MPDESFLKSIPFPKIEVWPDKEVSLNPPSEALMDILGLDLQQTIQ